MSSIGVSISGRLGPYAAIIAALLVANLFALTSPLIAALLGAGWSPGAVAIARASGSALVLLATTALIDRRLLRIRRGDIGGILAYGFGAVAMAQVGLILALQTLTISLAVSIQFLACVVVVAWEWARHQRRPTALTIGGTLLAIGGTIMVLDPFQGGLIDWTGVGWATVSMLGFVAFFIAPAAPRRPSALTLGAWGMVVGAGIVAVFVQIGILPAQFTGQNGTLAGRELPTIAILAVLVVACSVTPHLLTIAVVARLGATTTSLLLLTEVVFAGVMAWALRGQPFTLMAGIGAATLCSGICLAQVGDRWIAKLATGTPVEQPHAAATVEPDLQVRANSQITE